MAPSTRKRQARITFTPLPSSSPATQGYNKQIQDRAAAVGYGDSTSQPSKRRKLQPTDTANTNDMLPTPVEDLAASRDEPDKATKKAMKKRAKQQQRLEFAPSSSNGPVNLDPPVAPNMFKHSRGKKRAASTPSESEDSDDLPSPGRFAKKAKKSNKKRKTGFMSPGGNTVTRSSQREPTLQEDSDEREGGEEDEDEIVLPGARKARGQAQEEPAPQYESDEDDVVAPRTRSSQIRAQTAPVEDDSDSDDEMPTTLGTQKRRRKERQSSFISSSPPRATDGSEDELQIIEKPQAKKGKRQSKQAAEDEDEEAEPSDEDIEPVASGRRRLKQRGNKFTQQEQDDLDEDLEFLGPSSDAESDRAPRSSQSIKKNARQQALERLKQVRSSQRTLADIQEDEQGEEDNAVQQRELDELYDNSEESEAEHAPTSSRAMFDADEDDEDFIEEGDDDNLGVPEGIPLAFTRYASMKAKDLWKFAIEWMVQKKINPAFNGEDEIYTLTFGKLDDEVSALVGSKFASSAWTSEFSIALRSRPEIAYSTIDRHSAEHAFRDKCDACNRTGHPATSEVQFQGKPYHRMTLEEVGKIDDDDEDDDEDGESSNDSDEDSSGGDHPSYDAQGREVPPANRVWYLGKFCMSNARTAHALQHWRYHLYEWVVLWIDGHEYSTPKALKKRDKMSTKKRRKLANKIVDRMAEEGVVKQLWKEFRGTIDDAANAKQGRFEVASP